MDFVFILTDSGEEEDIRKKILEENDKFRDMVVVPGRENNQYESAWKSWGLFKWAGVALKGRYKFVLKVSKMVSLVQGIFFLSNSLNCIVCYYLN